jgi:hypothetical protein
MRLAKLVMDSQAQKIQSRSAQEITLGKQPKKLEKDKCC